MDICQSIQNLSKKPPESDGVLIQPLVNGVTQSALLTVLHLGTRTNQAAPDYTGFQLRWTKAINVILHFKHVLWILSS